MQKILPLFVLIIFVLSGLGAVALPEDIESLNVEEDVKLVLKIKGGMLGYLVSITNVGNESVSTNLSINITTNATMMIIGNELSYDGFEYDIESGESVRFKWGPVLGFGPAKINVEGVFSPGGWGFEVEADGFVLMFYVLVSFEPIPLP